MADSIDSSSDLQKQLDELEKSEDDLTVTAGGDPVEGAGRTGLPSWVKWMVIADAIIIAAVLIVIFSV